MKERSIHLVFVTPRYQYTRKQNDVAAPDSRVVQIMCVVKIRYRQV